MTSLLTIIFGCRTRRDGIRKAFTGRFIGTPEVKEECPSFIDEKHGGIGNQCLKIPGIGQSRPQHRKNMRKAGVDRSVIMKITGHKTMSMFERCNTMDGEDAQEALRRLGEYLCRMQAAENFYCNTTAEPFPGKRKGA